MKKGSRKFRYEWVLFASSLLFFLVSRFVMPRYEEILKVMNESEGTPWSTSFLILSVILFVLFLARVIWVLRRKPKG
ncbi:MAG: hypothetical protein ACON5H_02120 [Akkermansiaceae bacterium]